MLDLEKPRAGDCLDVSVKNSLWNKCNHQVNANKHFTSNQ